MNEDRKKTIRAYMNDQIKARGLTSVEFSMISGIPAPYISLIRNDITSNKLPDKVFTYLEGIYEDNAFQQLLNGDWAKYSTDRKPEPEPEVDLEKAFDMIKSFCHSRGITFELNFKLK